ncbi:hypothetical protein F5Y00DRAFT_274240 [Daldinia vernicosa]|uniref:uncharacterized protein n=1 Tax=Daldinia vernicosa TaxID=114800 RepID=UPI0020076AD1|nr:uncharacterized protein F5Y00DRAFT_274240 [Daldinia vernicosa]KAI0851985.1 hypothetical protein F5Y00DRAFT_274240 [Daldinia vernicosa]
MKEAKTGTGVAKPVYPVIQSVSRERHRHNAELRRVKSELVKLEAAQDQLWIENEQLKNLLKHLPDDSSLDEYVARIDELEKQNDALEEEVHELQGMSPDDIKELRAEQFPTLPRNSITQEDLKVEFRDYVDSIILLVYEWVLPLLTDEKHAAEVIETAKRDGTAQDFVTWLEAYPDIARLSSFKLSAEYTILAVIMRWLNSEIFGMDIRGVAKETITTLEHIEDSLANHIKPELRPIEIARWRQSTNYALVQHPEYKTARKAHEQELASLLQEILGFLPGVNEAGMLDRIRDTIIFRALELNELFDTSVDYFQIYVWDFLPGVSTGELSTAGELYEQQELFELADPLDNAKRYTIEDKSPDEATRRLDPVCAVIPAIVLTNVEDEDDAEVCCKAYIVAGWGLPKTRDRKWKEQAPGFLNALLAK